MVSPGREQGVGKVLRVFMKDFPTVLSTPECLLNFKCLSLGPLKAGSHAMRKCKPGSRMSEVMMVLWGREGRGNPYQDAIEVAVLFNLMGPLLKKLSQLRSLGTVSVEKNRQDLLHQLSLPWVYRELILLGLQVAWVRMLSVFPKWSQQEAKAIGERNVAQAWGEALRIQHPQRIGGSNCNKRLMGPRVSGTGPTRCLRHCTRRVYLWMARVHKNTKS